MSTGLITLFGLAHLFLFLIFFFLPGKSFKQRVWFQNLGKKLLSAKEKQLQTNPLLRRFSRAVEQESLGKAKAIIFSLIFLKSIGMAFIGIVGVSLIMVPLQAIMMAAIFQQTMLRGISGQGLLKVARFQLTAMLSATIIGNLIGWRIFIDQLTFSHTLNNELYPLMLTGLVTLFFCWLAAQAEVKFYMAHKALIG